MLFWRAEALPQGHEGDLAGYPKLNQLFEEGQRPVTVSQIKQSPFPIQVKTFLIVDDVVGVKVKKDKVISKRREQQLIKPQ